MSNKHQWIDDALEEIRPRCANYYRQLAVLSSEIGETELESSINDLLQRLEDPFMFVIVGEVKAGKSSFINALLETKEEICAVSPAPMTDTIQQIIYGEEEKEEVINEFLKRVYLPIPTLQQVAIVDTPGTNTIISHHQEITERFIPAADLVIFVFEAKNPYRQSAWEFFDYIHESWKRKILFILQQKDLLSEEDLNININGVKEHAKKKGIDKPIVFAVSAKDELEGRSEISGFAPVRKYIQEHVTGKQAGVLKLTNILNTGLQLTDRIDQIIGLRKEQYQADLAFREDISRTLDEETALSSKNVTQIIDALTGQFVEVTKSIEEELSDGLGIMTVLGRSFKSIFSKGQSVTSWLEQLNNRLQSELETKLRDKLHQGIFDLSERIQQMSRVVDLKINNSQTILKPDEGIFTDIAESRSQLLEELRTTFKDFLERPESFSDESIEKSGSKLAPQVATGTGMAIIGAMLTALTHGVVFDVTGGVLTAVGILFAGISIGWQKRKIISKYRKEINKGKQRLVKQLDETLNDYIEKIRERIERNFSDFDRHLDHEKKEIDRLHLQSKNARDLINGEIKNLKRL